MFYVGKSIFSGQREPQHIAEYKRWKKSGKPLGRSCNLHKLRKIGKIIKVGLEVQYERVCYFDDEREALNFEVSLIAYYGLSNLTNLTDGGEGTSGYRHTQQTKDKISEIHKGREVSEEHREALRGPRSHCNYQRGRKISAETRAKMSDSHKKRKRKPHSQETIEKIRMKAIGRLHSKETKEKIGASLKEKWGK